MTQQQIIVFCGADKTGKTEISQELSHKLKIPYFKASREKLKFRNGDHFVNEINYFCRGIGKKNTHKTWFDDIIAQSKLIEQVLCA